MIKLTFLIYLYNNIYKNNKYIRLKGKREKEKPTKRKREKGKYKYIIPLT